MQYIAAEITAIDGQAVAIRLTLYDEEQEIDQLELIGEHDLREKGAYDAALSVMAEIVRLLTPLANKLPFPSLADAIQEADKLAPGKGVTVIIAAGPQE